MMHKTSEFGVVFDTQKKMYEVGIWNNIKGLHEYATSLHFFVADDDGENADENASAIKMFSIFIELVAYYGFDPKGMHNEFLSIPAYRKASRFPEIQAIGLFKAE
ncbi:hypothetical protein HKD24_09205 [Gluconobacter sp. LMG 31484]|uniref:Uncharacterized protein n=1 Tax=Gluconobacter vitians TaxID=2728102 RepID=A0ABR9Y6L9_9PROT|nr:hypothetical protein [Gluconobacter vitians]MBF0859390.1 hypothetical protein [Gluconobacter vitians]